MFDIGSDGMREIDVIMLTRYACYLIAASAEPMKSKGWLRGFEPPTSGITIQRSNQLSYSHRVERVRSYSCWGAGSSCSAEWFFPGRNKPMQVVGNRAWLTSN